MTQLCLEAAHLDKYVSVVSSDADVLTGTINVCYLFRYNHVNLFNTVLYHLKIIYVYQGVML